MHLVLGTAVFYSSTVGSGPAFKCQLHYRPVSAQGIGAKHYAAAPRLGTGKCCDSSVSSMLAEADCCVMCLVCRVPNGALPVLTCSGCARQLSAAYVTCLISFGCCRRRCLRGGARPTAASCCCRTSSASATCRATRGRPRCTRSRCWSAPCAPSASPWPSARRPWVRFYGIALFVSAHVHCLCGVYEQRPMLCVSTHGGSHWGFVGRLIGF
jgi:hypothetical protein